MGGKSSASPSPSQQATTSTTQIPPWLETAAQGAVGTAQDLSQRPYTPYTGQMVAGQDPMQTQAYQEIQNQQGSADPAYAASANAYQGLLGSASPITAGGVNQNTNQMYGNYAGQVLAPTAGLLGNYLGNAGPATAQQVGSNAQQLMNPYTSSVINPMLQIAAQQQAQQNQVIAGQANNVGAFGGSRQGVQEGVAQAQSLLGTEQNVGNLLSTGYNAALTPGYNLASQASQQGYNAANQLAGMMQTGYGNAATGGQNLANTNLQAGLTAAQNLPSQAYQQAQLAQSQAGALQAAGSAQQQQQQAQLNAQMGQFYGQQDWPVQNLDLLISSLGGVPYSTTAQNYGLNQPGAQQRNVAGSALGGAASGAALGTAIFPGIGTAIGAVGGGLLGALG